jgi:DNA topoisomerase-1
VIVESPAKARTISRYLGPGYTIEASIGHIRDLPEGAKEIPLRYKQETWAHLGVDVDHGFDPIYVIPSEKTKQVNKLKRLLKDAKDLYLATDEDREGEAISWHLCQVLEPKVPVHRLVFHEITREAILQALTEPREIDEHLVRAQEARRIIDRLYGYEVSPLLWRKLRPRLSAGRVQSVAVRLIVDRERQRRAFVSASYWDVLGTLANSAGETISATLVSVDGRRIPSSRDFEAATGRLKDPRLLLMDRAQAEQLVARLRPSECRVAEVEDRPYTSRPYAPFTTSTLQQEANRRYGFTARRTMQAAQSLYENGHITYMRTDSTTLASVAVRAARDQIASQFGREYLPDVPRVYQTKVKNAQEAHEAIRPAGYPFDSPDSLRGSLSPDELKLYDLIWKRTIASQMADARGRRLTVQLSLGGAIFEAGGTTIEFPGYLRVYVETKEEPNGESAEGEAILPSVRVGEALSVKDLEPKPHATKPPNRYSEATLTRTLEELGIGRPSTYAAIIDTILARDYVFKRGNSLVPTWTAFAVCQLLEGHLPGLIDYAFTAEMEDELDAISRGEMGHVDYLRRFYFGDGVPGLKQLLADKTGQINARDVSRISLGKPEGEGPQAAEVFVRVGRFGPFVEQAERRASIPDKTAPDELSLSAALALLDKAQQAEQPLGTCPETGKPVYLKVGRFGPYVQRGAAEGDEKPQNASLIKGMRSEDVTLEVALKLLALPRELGTHPQTAQPVVAHNGRFGPFVKSGEETRSLPEGVSPLEVSLAQALELLSQPKWRRRAAGKEPVKRFDPSPVTQQPVQVLLGRYGPYVTDGVTNASLPRDASPEEITLAQALDLLAARAALGPSKRTLRKRAAKPVGPAKPAKPRRAKAAKKKKKAKKRTKRAAKTAKGEGD